MRRISYVLQRIVEQQTKSFSFSSFSTNSTHVSSLPTLPLSLVEKTTSTTLCAGKIRGDFPRKYYSTTEYSWYMDGETNDGPTSQISARSRFKEIPVHRSILNFIKSLGVGRRGKESRRKKYPFGYSKRRKVSKKNGEFGIMNKKEELQYFDNGRITRRPSMTENSTAKNAGKMQSFLSLPPPPFGDETKIFQARKLKSKTTTKSKLRSIRVFPVKVLRRVTSASSLLNYKYGDDNDRIFSRSPMSRLPEVAIIGRSNVGKSTLLNSLLYSGRSIDKEQSEAVVRRRNRRLRSRFVSSQTAKLPKGLKAKTSSKPGETQSIDFYQLSAEIEESYPDENKQKEKTQRSGIKNNSTMPRNRGKITKKKLSLILVDLPGYGFAFGPKKERKESHGDDGRNNHEISPAGFLYPWQALIETYITNRPRSSLKRVLLLIDARHGMKDADYKFMTSLQKSLIQKQQNTSKGKDNKHQVPTELPPLQIVLTKCDLVSQVDLARRVVQVRQQLSDCLIRQPKILPEMLVSAEIEGQGGVLELQKELASLCGGDLQRV